MIPRKRSTAPGWNGHPDFGRVEVCLFLDVPPAKVWHALTDLDAVDRWFGTIRPALRTGGRAILDFGDGDFFTLRWIRLEPSQRLRYSWRFLGIGPLDTITWRLIPAGCGCELTVTDEEPGRLPQEAEQLRLGWLDFTGRLAGFLATGERTRYDWRREFDGAVELAIHSPAAWEVLFDPSRQPQWLPLGGPALKEGVPLVLDPEPTPALTLVTMVHWDPPTRVTFQIEHPDWLQPTACSVRLSPRGDRVLLSVSHVGWEAINPDLDVPLAYRRRFAAMWIETLGRAARLTGAGYPVNQPYD